MQNEDANFKLWLCKKRTRKGKLGGWRLHTENASCVLGPCGLLGLWFLFPISENHISSIKYGLVRIAAVVCKQNNKMLLV